MDNEETPKTIYSFDGMILNANNVLRIEESFTDTYIIMLDGKKYKSALSIDELEWELSKKQFTRVHPKHLINTHFKVHRFTMNMDCIQLLNGENVPVARGLVEDYSEKCEKNLIKKLKNFLFRSKKATY